MITPPLNIHLSNSNFLRFDWSFLQCDRSKTWSRRALYYPEGSLFCYNNQLTTTIVLFILFIFWLWSFQMHMFIARYCDLLNVEISCDGCERIAPWHRYRCLQCTDMDLCKTCFLSKPKPFQLHLFFLLPKCKGFSQVAWFRKRDHKTSLYFITGTSR